MITFDTFYTIQRVSGLSQDDKPLGMKPGSIFMELDTGKKFIFDGETWHEQPQGGGGGGLVDATYTDYEVQTPITKWYEVWDLCTPDIASKRDAGGLSIKDDVYIIECPSDYATTESYIFSGPWYGFAVGNTSFNTCSVAYRPNTGTYEGGLLSYQSSPANRDCQIPAGVVLRCWHIPRRY